MKLDFLKLAQFGVGRHQHQSPCLAWLFGIDQLCLDANNQQFYEQLLLRQSSQIQEKPHWHQIDLPQVNQLKATRSDQSDLSTVQRCEQLLDQR